MVRPWRRLSKVLYGFYETYSGVVYIHVQVLKRLTITY